MYHYEKVLKASDKSDIVWFVSSFCNSRRDWPEYTVKIIFCFPGAVVVLQGAVVRRPISVWVSFSFVQKHFFG